MTQPPRTTREEDYRDYEERDLDEGWPYADRDGQPALKKNAAYGTSASNFDEIGNSGMDLSTEPVAEDIHGAPLPFADASHDSIDDDGLEEWISQRLEDDERIDPTSLELTVRNGVVEIEGSVDSEADRVHLIRMVRAMAGVKAVRTEGLTTRGVDSHIPSDSDM